MGAWGPRLYQDDVAEDIKEAFNALYKEDIGINEITELLISKYNNITNDKEDGPVFWFALADIQWKYGLLQSQVKEMALKYIDDGSDLITWLEVNPKEAKAREKVLEDLKLKLQSPMPAVKKIKEPNLYKCQWNINDVFAYKLDSDYALEKGLYGRYIIIRKIDEGEWWPGHIVPIVYFSITSGTVIPNNFDAIKESKYMINFKARGGIEYRMLLLNTSKRIIPKKLQYIGNFENLLSPNNELIFKEKIMYGQIIWRDFEKTIIDIYLKYNE